MGEKRGAPAGKQTPLPEDVETINLNDEIGLPAQSSDEPTKAGADANSEVPF